MSVRRFLVFLILALAIVPTRSIAETKSVGLASHKDGRLALFSLDSDGAALVRTQASPNGCWGQASGLQGHDLLQIAPATNGDGRLELFALGSDGIAYHRWQSQLGDWGSWTTLEGTQLKDITAAKNQDGRLELFAVGGQGAIYHKWQASAGAGFGGWNFLGGHDLRQIAATKNQDGRLELFGVGNDGIVYHVWQVSPGGGFGEWHSLGGHDIRQISASANQDGRLELFAVGADGRVYHKWQLQAGAGFGDWSTLQGVAILKVAAGRSADGSLELVALGSDDGLYRNAQAIPGGTWRGWSGLGRCTEPATREQVAAYRELAAYWAPVISQDIDANNINAEYITKVDYDGNWNGRDNQGNLLKFPLAANVYYWVTESESTYFIGYAFFHPRDWSNSGTFEHENDLEGILLAVAKDRARPKGKFLAMVTVAHSDFWSFTDDDTSPESPWYSVVERSRSVTNGGETIDGDMDFVVDDIGVHPVVYIQSEGHGAYGHPRASTGAVWHQVSDYAPIFQSKGMTDWTGANWSGIEPPPVSGSPSERHTTDGWGDGVIYHFENQAEIPAPAGETSNDKLPHNWEVIGYQLVNVTDLWERRFVYACASADGSQLIPETERIFDSYGDFPRADAQAPWGWNDGGDHVRRGAFFEDPEGLFQTYFDGLGTDFVPANGTYIRNSYETPAKCPANWPRLML